MELLTGEEPPPKSTDLEGWRWAVEEDRHRQFRLEDIVAAIQDLGLQTDKRVLNALAKHLSDAIMRILSKRVDARHPNKGRDIIERTHAQIIDAVLDPTCSDGKALRIAFVPRVEFRIKDAISKEARAARMPWSEGADESEQSPPKGPTLATCCDSDSEIVENMDVENVLRLITDDQKRLAFRLHMDGVPFKSKKACSIASSLGISEKTAREWIKEVQALLATTREVQDLIEARRRAAP
jgi:hypothetical protein